MLYYVKIDRIFKSMPVEIEEQNPSASRRKFFFDVSKLQHKKANEKRELVFDLCLKAEKKLSSAQ